MCSATPDLKLLIIRGCKCYALKPKGVYWREDFDEKAYLGFLVGYAAQNTGYLVFVPSLDNIIVSVHVVFNEIMPNPTDGYFAKLKRLMKINVALESHDPADYQFLAGMQHIDDEDGLVYETTRVTVCKGYIKVYHRLVTTEDSKPREELTPIHI